jgi:hypothetical protein
VYSPSFIGLHAWHELSVAKERMQFVENDFLYEFEYPIDSIEELITVEHGAVQANIEKPCEIAVKLKEDSGPGKNNYHAVIIDYSKITNWRELDSNKNSKYLIDEQNLVKTKRQLDDKVPTVEVQENSKIKDYANCFLVAVVAILIVIFSAKML